MSESIDKTLKSGTQYDVTIIGGGIQGCAVAQAAAAAGFSTLLIEQQDWAWATSSRSSKLIHGGLRYLQTGQFHLVKECLAERDWMIRYCPELVKARYFYLPVYKQGRYKSWFIWLGLFFYKLLNWSSPYSNFRRLSAQQWRKIPHLNKQGLQTVFEYCDGQTDDKALTLAVKDSAHRLGADCFNHTALLSSEKTASAYQLQLSHQGQKITIDTQMVINASGPWVNECLQKFTPALPCVSIDKVQGTHIIIAAQISEHCFYVEAPSDQRAIFIMPWKGKTLIGTTELLHDGKPEDTAPTEKEISYLQEVIQCYFPTIDATVVEAFSGLRVLPKSTQSAFFRSRDVMLTHHEGVVSLYGGKLTAWRATAKSVLAIVESQLGRRKKVDSRTLALK